MDVIYPISLASARGDELRWSYRSLGNITHDRVVIAGVLPKWATHAVHVMGVDGSHDRARNVQRKVLDALKVCGPDVVVMGDDMLILRPLDVVGMHYCGTIGERMAKAQATRKEGDQWRMAIEATAEVCGTDAPDCGAHWPQRYDRALLGAVLERSLGLRRCIDFATLYAVTYMPPMRRVRQAKRPVWDVPGGDVEVLSTHPRWERDPRYRAWAARRWGLP